MKTDEKEKEQKHIKKVLQLAIIILCVYLQNLVSSTGLTFYQALPYMEQTAPHSAAVQPLSLLMFYLPLLALGKKEKLDQKPFCPYHSFPKMFQFTSNYKPCLLISHYQICFLIIIVSLTLFQ